MKRKGEKNSKSIIIIIASLLSDYHLVCQSSIMRKDLKIKIHFLYWENFLSSFSSVALELICSVLIPGKYYQIHLWARHLVGSWGCQDAQNHQFAIFTSVHWTSSALGCILIPHCASPFPIYLARLSIFSPHLWSTLALFLLSDIMSRISSPLFYTMLLIY